LKFLKPICNILTHNYGINLSENDKIPTKLKRIESKIELLESIFNDRNKETKKLIESVAGSLYSINRFVKDSRIELDIYKDLLKSNKDKESLQILLDIKQQFVE